MLLSPSPTSTSEYWFAVSLPELCLRNWRVGTKTWLAPTLTSLSSRYVTSCGEGASLGLDYQLALPHYLPFLPFYFLPRAVSLMDRCLIPACRVPGNASQHHCTSVCGACSYKNSEKLNSALCSLALCVSVSISSGKCSCPLLTDVFLWGSWAQRAWQKRPKASPSAFSGERVPKPWVSSITSLARAGPAF